MRYDSTVSKIYENGNTISLFSLAVPKFFEQIFLILLSTVNTLMLSGYSQDAVAATSVAGQLENAIIIVLNVIISGMTIIMSIELGKKDQDCAARIAGTATISMVVISLAAGITAAFFSEQLVEIMNLCGNPKTLSSNYFRIRGGFIFTATLLSLFNNLLICNGYALYSFLVGVLVNVLNVVLGYIVLYSGLELPLQGVSGIAVAGIIARIISIAAAIYLYKKRKCPFTLAFDARIFRKILRIGIPSGLGMASYTATQIVTTGFMASLGTNILNAKVYIVNIVNYTSKIGWAVANANGVLMGRYRGRGDFDKMKVLYRQNLMIALSSNLILSILAFVLHRPLISIFTDDTGIFAFAASVMAIDIIVEIARAVNNVAEQSLNANGDVKITFVVPLFTCWIFGVLLAYVLSIKCGLGLVGCWIGFAADEAVKAALYSIRWKRGKWREIQI